MQKRNFKKYFKKKKESALIMRKQTKLVAVLSTAALLAIGASMTSFAATGWAEEDGTWVYYNRDGERATDQWRKSGNNWYWLDSNGEMAIDQLIEDGDNYYYVDINGVMAANQWVAIDNEDAGQDDEPDHYWYYFQANGKALKNGDNSKVALKTVNGKKYAFDDEGKMLFGWVAADNAERIDNTDGDGFKEGDYYFGGEDDGAMTVGWLQMILLTMKLPTIMRLLQYLMRMRIRPVGSTSSPMARKLKLRTTMSRRARPSMARNTSLTSMEL